MSALLELESTHIHQVYVTGLDVATMFSVKHSFVVECMKSGELPSLYSGIWLPDAVKWYDSLSMDVLEQQGEQRCCSEARRQDEWRIAGLECRKKLVANYMTAQAHKQGALIRKPCEVCGVEPTHAHHDDYDRPLEVRYLCARHHSREHAIQQRMARTGWTKEQTEAYYLEMEDQTVLWDPSMRAEVIGFCAAVDGSLNRYKKTEVKPEETVAK
jgi:hypothetical protein